MQFTRFRGYVYFVPITETLTLLLASGGVKRGISQRLVGGQTALRLVAAEIADAMRAVQPDAVFPEDASRLLGDLLAKHGTAKPQTGPGQEDRDELDDWIDTELSKMD